MTADFFVTLQHLHSVPGLSSRPGFCHKGARQLADRYQLDWAQIVARGGIEASRLLATGDAMAKHLVDFAREEVVRGQQQER